MKNKRSRKKIKGKKLKISFWWLIGAILLAIALTILPYRFRRTDGSSGDTIPDGDYLLIADISHHNGPSIVWDSLLVMTDSRGRTVRSIDQADKVTRLEGIYIKATEGESMVDENFSDSWKNAEAHQIRRGAYHYFLPSKSPVNQANHFIKTVGPLRSDDLPPVLDVETILKNEGAKKLNEKALKWLQTVEEYYGIKPVVYCPDNYALFVISSDIKNSYPIWVAHYGVPFPLYRNWKCWQFSEKAIIKGIPGLSDLSVLKRD
ncbi:MAG: hypothetical protein IKR69_05360 [Bacteroidales bacterium]|nr:hypothetical protein [Bacteroidales bacterium]